MLIALTRLFNVFEVFVAGIVGQLDFLDVPALATGCLGNKVVRVIMYLKKVLWGQSCYPLYIRLLGDQGQDKAIYSPKHIFHSCICK